MADLIVTKSFSPSTIAPGGISTLTITVNNPNNFVVTNVSFTDTYPVGVINNTPPNENATIGIAIAAPGGPSITWTTAVLGEGLTAIITVEVTSDIAGSYENSTGPVVGIEESSPGASAVLVVEAPHKPKRRLAGLAMCPDVFNLSFASTPPPVVSCGGRLYGLSRPASNRPTQYSDGHGQRGSQTYIYHVFPSK